MAKASRRARHQAKVQGATRPAVSLENLKTFQAVSEGEARTPSEGPMCAAHVFIPIVAPGGKPSLEETSALSPSVGTPVAMASARGLTCAPVPVDT